MPLRAISKAHTGLAVAAFLALFSGHGILILVTGDYVLALLGLVIYVAVFLAFAITYSVLLVRARRRVSWRRLPATLVGFILLVVVSIAWSPNNFSTVLNAVMVVLTTVIALGIAVLLPWRDLVRALGTTLRWILAVCLACEIYVGFNNNSSEVLHRILGPADELGFLALIALIVFSAQLVDGTVWRIWGIAWLAIAIGTLALNRSSTVLLAFAAVVLVLGFALWARVIRPGARRGLYGVAALVLLGIATWAIFGRGILSTTFGASAQVVDSLTLWNTPNAWLDMWGQLGIVGLVVFAFFGFSTTWRAWFVAVDRPRWDLTDQRPFMAGSLLPLLILAALLAQSLSESQLLVQSDWALLVICAVVMKTPARVHGAQN